MIKRSTQKFPRGKIHRINLRRTLAPNGRPTGLYQFKITSQRPLGRATRVLPKCRTKNMTKNSQWPPWTPRTAL